jgi:tripartite-type tricarboxylate transporter receptor subunit TctC
MKRITGVPLTNVPYRGQASVALPFANDKRVKIIAVAGKERASPMPHVPTTAELELPALVMENRYALYAPRDTPAPHVRYRRKNQAKPATVIKEAAE